MELIRFANFNNRTLGRATLGDLSWWTIERPWLDNAPSVSCIPVGEYTMVRVNSPRFGPDTWEVADVPGRTHILIHTANYAQHDVEGCIGFGRGLFANLEGVTNSANAVAEFYRITSGIKTMPLVIREAAFRVDDTR
jgi:hypothetical protein